MVTFRRIHTSFYVEVDERSLRWHNLRQNLKKKWCHEDIFTYSRHPLKLARHEIANEKWSSTSSANGPAWRSHGQTRRDIFLSLSHCRFSQFIHIDNGTFEAVSWGNENIIRNSENMGGSGTHDKWIDEEAVFQTDFYISKVETSTKAQKLSTWCQSNNEEFPWNEIL